MKINISVSNEAPTQEEVHLTTKLGNPLDFKATCLDGSMGKYAKMKYLTKAWNKANKEFFDGHLKMPVLILMRNSGTRFKMRGYWQAGTRTIAISPRLFNAGDEPKVLTTLVHEMCHQAESEIDSYVDQSNGCHGARWIAWMHQCGLTGNRYSQYDNQTFLADDEKEEQAHMKKLVDDAREKKSTHKRLNVSDWTPAQYYNVKKEEWVAGLIVCRGDKKGDRWCFLADPTGTSFVYVQWNQFYHIENEYEAREILDNHAYIRIGDKIARMMRGKGYQAWEHAEWKAR